MKRKWTKLIFQGTRSLRVFQPISTNNLNYSFKPYIINAEHANVVFDEGLALAYPQANFGSSSHTWGHFLYADLLRTLAIMGYKIDFFFAMDLVS